MFHLLDLQLQLSLLGEIDKARKISDRLDRDIPDNPRHKFNRAWFVINSGDMQTGYRLMEAGRDIQVYGNPLPEGAKINPLPSPDQIPGSIVLLHLEGGYGDNFIYVRFARVIKELGGTCIVCVQKNLHSIIERIDGVQKCITEEEAVYEEYDYTLQAFSAPWVLKFNFNSLINTPYIISDKSKVEDVSAIFECAKDKLKVGIKWSGNPKFEHQQFRRFPTNKIIELCKTPNTQFYSLQKDFDLVRLPDNIIDLQYALDTWETTAAVIDSLDLVITSCTAVAHLASAMGKPTWIILPALPYHIWAYGDKHSPWYQKTTTLYRQAKLGQWDKVFDDIQHDLLGLSGQYK